MCGQLFVIILFKKALGALCVELAVVAAVLLRDADGQEVVGDGHTSENAGLKHILNEFAGVAVLETKGKFADELAVADLLKVAGLEELILEEMCAGIAEFVDFAETLFAHKREIASHEEAHIALSGADVRGCLFTTNVLLASLHGEHESALAIGVGGGAHEATGHLADKSVLDAEVTDVRTAEAHGDAEALAVATSDVGAPLAGSANCRAKLPLTL